MRAREFWKTVTVDHSNLLDDVIDVLRRTKVPFCIVGGQAVNAYVEPVVSLDLDIAMALDRVKDFEAALSGSFNVERFQHSLNVSRPGSDLRVQIQLDPRYGAFVDRATVRNVLGVELPVAAIEDVLAGKVWAVLDPARRGSKRQKDLADISRIVEAFPGLRDAVPADVLSRLI